MRVASGEMQMLYTAAETKFKVSYWLGENIYKMYNWPERILEYRIKKFWTSLVAQVVNNPPAMQKTLVRCLGWEDPLEKG